MSSFIAHIHAEVRRARLTRRGATHAAKDVPQGLHKEYERMRKIPLPEAMIGTPLSDVLKKRHSCRSGDPEEILSLTSCGALLGNALKKHERGTRNYPSGGALYPVETYLVSTSLEGETPAVFHYNPTAHALERLWDLPAHFDMKSIVRLPEDLFFSTIVIFTSVWKRSSAKYGTLSYSHALLEAGHMSENILLAATALGLCSCPMAGFDDERVIELLDLDPEEEQPVHSIVLCAAHKKKERSIAEE